MTDYIFQVSHPHPTDRHLRTSTAGDSTTQFDQWLWPPHGLLNTPSKKRGMAWTEESYLRGRAVNWVVRICITLQLPQLIIATAAAYIHRFYMRKPLQKYSPKVMSATALFLATKVEEVPRKLEYVVREYLKVDEDGNEAPGVIAEDSNDFQFLKQQILYYEDILLRTLCFDLAVDHPYVPLVQNVKSIHQAHSSRTPKLTLSVELADRSKAKSIMQAAWGFVNDSLMTPLCVIAKPELIAASAFLLAVSHRLSECPPPEDDHHHQSQDHADLINFDHYLNLPVGESKEDDHTLEPWWKVFKVESLEEIYEVANAMLDQYDLSVCDYIREKAGKLARFPGPSLLCPAVQMVEAEVGSKIHPSPKTNGDSKKYPEEVKNSCNKSESGVPSPAITGHDEMCSRETERGSLQKTESDLPSVSVSEQDEVHPRGGESTSEKMDLDAPSINISTNGKSHSSEMDTSPQAHSSLQSPHTAGGREREESRSQDAESHREIYSTPARHHMSDSMDLGTSVDSDNSWSKSHPGSPSRRRKQSPRRFSSQETTTPSKKRSRPRDHSSADLHPPKTPRLEHTSRAPVEHPAPLPPLPAECLIPDPPLGPPPSIPEPCIDQNLAKQNQPVANPHHSESSLSDMEDGELD